jgi:glycerophosphoryl diester phosphodiesterase
LLSSFSVVALAAAKESAPDVPRMLLTEEVTDAALNEAARLQCLAVCCDHNALDAHAYPRLREAGLHVLVYTVNDPDRVDALIALGVDGVCTDDLDVMARRFPQLLAKH